jgi:hypothetical protein
MKKILKITFSILLLCIGVAEAGCMSDIIITSSYGNRTDKRSFTTLADAITAVGVTEKRTIVVASAETVGTLTIPSNITLEFQRGGYIENSGQLTIHTTNIVAGDYQIFYGSGGIDFACGTKLRSTWFEDLHRAFDVTNNNYVTLIITSGWSAAVDADCAVGNNVILKWEGPGNRIVINSGFELSNIKNIDAGSYEVFGGSGDLDFADGTILDLRWFKRIRSATAWVESENVTIEVKENTVVDYNTTISSNAALKVNKGAVITVSPGVTLTIAGYIIAGEYQIFAGTGTLQIRKARELLLSWYGFAEGATAAIATSNKTAIDRAVASVVPGTGKAIVFPKGSFLIDPEITPNSTNITFKGSSSPFGMGGGWIAPPTSIEFTNGTNGFDLRNSRNCTIENLLISQTKYKLSNGIVIGATAAGSGYGNCCTVNRCTIIGTSTAAVAIVDYAIVTNIINSAFINNLGHGIYSYSPTVGQTTTNMNIINTLLWSNKGAGLYLEHGRGVSVQDCIFEGNVAGGVVIYSKVVNEPANVKVEKCWFEQNGATVVQQIQMIGDADMCSNGISFVDCYISGNRISGVAVPGILVDRVHNANFRGCVWDGGNREAMYYETANALNVTFDDSGDLSAFMSPVLKKQIVGGRARSGDVITENYLLADANNWYATMCTVASVADGTSQTGRNLTLTRTSGANQNIQGLLGTFPTSNVYEVSAYVKSGTSGNEAFEIGIYDNNYMNLVDKITGTTSENWIRYRFRIVNYSFTGEVSIRLTKNSATPGTMLFDYPLIAVVPMYVGEFTTKSGDMGTAYFADNISVSNTITDAGTTSVQTINKAAGSINLAAGEASKVVHNNLVTADSIILATVATNDATALIKNVVAGAGDFTITMNAAVTGETRVNWFVIND